MADTLFKTRLSTMLNSTTLNSGSNLGGFDQIATVGDATEKILGQYVLPANTIKTIGQGVKITVSLKYAANARDKFSILYIGGAFFPLNGLDTNNSTSTVELYIYHAGTLGGGSHDIWFYFQETMCDFTTGVQIQRLIDSELFANGMNFTINNTLKITGQDDGTAADDITKVGFVVEII